MNRTFFTIMILAAASVCGGGDNPGTTALQRWKARRGLPAEQSAEEKRENQHLVDFLLNANKYPWTWIQLIEKYELYDELEITDRQRKELVGIQSPTPASVAAHMNGGDYTSQLRKPKKEFWRWLREDWSPQMTRHHKSSNDAVEAILKPKQTKRLREIGFQFQAILHAGATAAYRMHDIQLSKEKSAELKMAFGRGKRLRWAINEILSFRERCKIISDRVGKEKFDNATGELVYFADQLDHDIMDELIGEEEEQSKEANPRRSVR